MTKPDSRREVATLAGGCFWCLEAVYQEVEGVEEIVSGYTGGSVPNPSYRQVCSGETGHAEVVQVHFDPARISYRRILEIFFAIHDPTTMNAQGADVGTQYRSAIFVHTPEQRAAAEALVEELETERLFDDPIVTEIEDSTEFYPAEVYHRNYYRDNSSQPYCRAVITPKLAKFRQKFLAPQGR
jgi:peptide-methionine (S)-S-oxide reductase